MSQKKHRRKLEMRQVEADWEARRKRQEATESMLDGLIAVAAAIHAAGSWRRAVKFGLIDQPEDVMEVLRRFVPRNLGGDGEGQHIDELWASMAGYILTDLTSRRWLSEMEQQVLEREAEMNAVIGGVASSHA